MVRIHLRPSDGGKELEDMPGDGGAGEFELSPIGLVHKAMDK